MKRLIIYTRHPDTVRKLLLEHDLVESRDAAIHFADGMVIDYRQDALSQEITFWFALAQGCGLVTGHRIDS